MREYIRHPTDMPIEYDLGDVIADQKEYLNDISLGGLSFKSKYHIETGSAIKIRIPLRKPEFEEEGIVVWINKKNELYDAGVQFKNAISEFRIRMIEQVCHIEQYKKNVFEKEGRAISGEEAVTEWIKKYGKDFSYD